MIDEELREEESTASGEQAANVAPVIEDERKYTTRQAGELIGLHQQTIISHIKRHNITAERRIETRGPVYYITGAEIKRFKRERRPRGFAGHRRPADEDTTT